MATLKQYKKKFDTRREKGGDKLRVAFYMDAMRNATELPKEEYVYFVRDVFSAFLFDLHFLNIIDGIFAKDETASARVFKKEMQRLLREKGIDDHYLLRQ